MRRKQNPNGQPPNDVGLSMMSALSVFGVHSAVNPSYFTLRAFANNPEAQKRASEGVYIGLGLGLLTAYAVWRVFHKPMPAGVAALSAVAMAGVSLYAIHAPSPPQIGPIQSCGFQQTVPTQLPPGQQQTPPGQQAPQGEQPRAGLPAPQRSPVR